MISVGADGCRVGWVAARVRSGGSGEAAIFPSIDALWESWGASAAILLIDVPIGLAEEDSCRSCDREARQLLRAPRASSVFNPPVRAALRASSWEEAASINASASGSRIAKQTWAIMPKILEVDQFLDGAPERHAIIREVHPEVLFHVLNGGRQLANRKTRSASVLERLAILETVFAGSREIAESAFRSVPRKRAKRDDIVDALAAAVVGFVFHGQLRTIPAVPAHDRVGRPMEMVIPPASLSGT